VEILERLAGQKVVVRCARCDGSGRARPDDFEADPCWVCRGDGKLLLHVSRMPLIACSRCRGTGRQQSWNPESRECRTCRGSGCQSVAGYVMILS
jgi:DnaJ-class molecular chaperone